MSTTDDPNDPRLKKIDSTGMQEVYLVLSEEERAKGFVRPVRLSYKHVGLPAPVYELRDLNEEEKARSKSGYVKYEIYPDSMSPITGKYWTQAELDRIGRGCQTITTMNQALAETYARDPTFYGATYCGGCKTHRPVNEFVWIQDGSRVGS